MDTSVGIKKKIPGLATRTRFVITESDLKKVAEIARSGKHASELLGVSKKRFDQFAKIYNHESGVSYYDYFKSLSTRNSVYKKSKRETKEYYVDILLGKEKVPLDMDLEELKNNLTFYGLVADKCMWPDCGFCERRPHDYKIPTVITFKDGDRKNGKEDNIDILCFNHYFINHTSSKLAKRYIDNMVENDVELNDDYEFNNENIVITEEDIQNLDSDILENIEKLGVLE